MSSDPSEDVSSRQGSRNRPLHQPHHSSPGKSTAADPISSPVEDVETTHSSGEVPEVPARRGRVRFNSKSQVDDLRNPPFSFPLQDSPVDPAKFRFPGENPTNIRDRDTLQLPKTRRGKHESDNGDPFSDAAAVDFNVPVPKRPRPSVLRNTSALSFTNMMATGDGYNGEQSSEKVQSAQAAHKRAQKIASMVGLPSPPSRRSSVESSPPCPHSPDPGGHPSIRLDDIPLMDMDNDRYNNGGLDSDEEDFEKSGDIRRQSSVHEARKLVRSHTKRENISQLRLSSNDDTIELESGQVTPSVDREYAEHYVARPEHFRGGVLSSLLKLYNQPSSPGHKRHSSAVSLPGSPTPGSSGTSTPIQRHPKWYDQKAISREALSDALQASTESTASGPSSSKHHGKHSRMHSGGRKIDRAFEKLKKQRLEDEIRITVHIAETLSRQKYLIKLCRALMAYGAPTHRLEEYMRMTARVLELDGQFLYIPGCMLISLDDASTHTTEVKLVRTTQGVNLGKLKDAHDIYKEVVHDVIGVEEATQRLEAIMREKPKHNKWLLVFVYGLASAFVGPFAFEANFIDLPIAFVLGCVLGFLQLIVAPKSDLYANVFEVTASVITSFLARAFGSIHYSNGNRLFCFSALAQSGIVLILPGYIILCGALELQSKSIVPGSVRMFYAIIYSLFLGFGITVGTALYGVMDSNAVSATSCPQPMNLYIRFAFVPLFTMCLCVINHAKWRQTPVMLLISCSGYLVNFFTAKRFPSNAQISQTLGAFAVGVLGNLYSRLRHGVAVTALLPAIFVQVPSGLAASGTLLAGLASADNITSRNGTFTNGTTIVSKLLSEVPVATPSSRGGGKTALAFLIGTQDLVTAQKSATDTNSTMFNVGYSMIQVAIGISVGLFLSALVIYPFGKRRSGLFSF